MPSKGSGKSSKTWLPTHQFKKYGVWWRSEEDFKVFQKEFLAKRRETKKRLEPEGRPRKPKHGLEGRGVTSTVWRPTHQFYAWGRYWPSEEVWRERREHNALRNRANRNEVSIEHQVKMERQIDLAEKIYFRREQALQKEFDRLRAKHGLSPIANRRALRIAFNRTNDPEILRFFHMQSIATMGSEEKLKDIRALFSTPGIKPIDIIYRTALIVGVEMKEKQ